MIASHLVAISGALADRIGHSGGSDAERAGGRGHLPVDRDGGGQRPVALEMARRCDARLSAEAARCRHCDAPVLAVPSAVAPALRPI
ncbi:hypothetical protein Jiend_61520 [Micromonospora endophytica]|nr:hypothetical protein Jiend_61520 [Micromonospora endophytica]